MLISNAFGQNCPSSPAISQEYRPVNVCSFEKQVWWDISFNVNPADIDPALFDGYFVFNWGDDPATPANSTIDVIPATFNAVFNDWEFTNPAVVPAPFNDSRFGYFGNYPDDLEVCEITVTVSLEFMDAGDPYDPLNSFKCSQLRNTQTSDYYSFDNEQPGELVINPQGADDITVCEGGAEVTLFDDSRFNCVLPADTDNPNDNERHIRWVYGVAGSDMANVIVGDGTPYQQTVSGVANYIPQDGGNDLVDNYPANVDNNSADSESLEITIPGSATPGDMFIVRMDNWGPCNPYNPADPTNPPPVSIEKVIRIVAAPQAEPQVRDDAGVWQDNSNNPNAAVSFCVGDDVDFRTDINENDEYDWDFDWDGDIGNFDVDANNNRTPNNINFTTAGKLYHIGLRITRGNTGPPCVEYKSIFVQIEEGPVANFDFDITSTDQCEDIIFGTNNTSTNPNTDNIYTWVIRDGGGSVITPTNFSGQENSEDLAGIEISGIGEYTVELTATSPAAPSCPTTETKSFFIYDQPTANFSATEICEGDATTFTDLSNIPTVIDGDFIDTWEFVFDFDETDFTTDPEATFDSQTITTLGAGDFNASDEYNYTYPAAGTYNVALRVTTNKGGCTSDVFTATVEVKNNPTAAFAFDPTYQTDNGIDYTQPLCPGTPIAFINNSPSGQTDPTVERYYIRVEPQNGAVASFEFPPNPADFWVEGNVRVIDPTNINTLMPNPNSSANYTYDFTFIAVGDNGCETEVTPSLSITLLPEDVAGFNIFEGDPATADLYDNSEVYCSPKEFYFETTENFNADQYIWTVTDGLGEVVNSTTINTATDPNPEQFSLNFENNFPSVSQEIFNINLQVITDDFCVTDRNETLRLFPKPTAEFEILESVIECDSVFYTFKAIQDDLEYNWSVNSTDNTKLGSAIQDDPNSTYTVRFGRPDDTEPDLDFTVELNTENLVLCPSDTETMDVTIPNKEIVTVDIDFIPADSEDCLPSVYDLQNTTALAPPAGTEWEFEIYKFNTATTIYDLVETIKGEDQPVGNEDFSTAIPYEFTERGTYRIDLVANLVSNCRIGLSTPVEIDIYETPEPNFRTNITQGCSPLEVTLIENSLSSSGDPFDLSVEVYDPVNNTVTQTIAATSGTGGQLNNFLLDPLINTTTDFIDYEITLTATANNALSCSLDSTVTVRVYQQPEIDFAVISTNPACQQDYEFTFDITSLNVPAGTDLIWNWGNGDPVLVTDETVTTVSHEYSNRASFFGDDTYTVTLTAETPNNCSVSVTETIDLHPRLQAQFNASTEQGCDPLNVTFTSASLGTNIAGGHEYYKRIQGATTWDVFNSTVSSSGTVTELFETNIWEVLYIVQGEGGCRDTAAIKEITVFPSPDLEVNVLNSPLCQIDENGDYEFEFELNNVNVPAGTEFTWSWGDGSTPLTTNSDANQTHIFNNRLSYFGTDNYTITVSAETTDGCIINESVNIQLRPQIEAIFFQNLDEGCAPLEVNLTSSSRGTGLTGNYLYQRRVQGSSTWNTITGGETNGSTSDIFENTTGSDIVYEVRHIVSSDVGNCADTSDISEILVSPEFSTPALTGPEEVCSFQQEAVYSIPHTMGSTYNWQLPLGAFISSQNANGNQVKINFSSFSGNVSVSEINANGCIGEPNTKSVTVLSGPEVTLSLNGPNTICPGDETSLLFDLEGEGSQGFDVIYSDGVQRDTLENISDGHIETITPTQSRNYFVLDVIDREYPNCNAARVSGNAFVNVNFAPTASISGNATICEDGSANLLINLTGAGPWEVVYTDQNSNFTLENINSPVYQLEVSPEANTTYELISVTDSNTPVCSGTVEGSVSVDINPKPTANIFGDFDNICANESVELGIELTGFAPWTVRYTDGNNTFTIPNITPPAGFDPENDSYVHNFDVFPNTGTTSYTLVDVRDSNAPSCSGDISGTAVVRSYNRPTAEIEGNNTICFGESSPITFNFTGDGPFDVLITANQDSIEYNGLQNGQSVNLSPENSTVYRVVQLVDNRGCLGNSLGSPISINVNQLPTSEISGNDVTCNGEETELIFDQTGVGPWTITYSNGSQNFSFTTSFNRHFEPVFPTTTTTYTLVSVVDSNSPDRCTGTVSGSALKEVFPELEASFEATPEEMILPESTVSITNTTTNKNEWEYEWDFGDGTTSTEIDPAPHEYGTFGTFVIRMTATNGQCTDTYQTTITIGAIPPIVDFDADPREGCLPLVVEFENLTRFADPSTYQWEFGDGQRVSAVENPTHVYRNPGTYSVRLSATNITGQRTEMFKQDFIVVNETPVASFTIPDEYRQVFTTEEVRFVNLSEGADEFIWRFGDGNESFEEEPIHAYPDSGIYDITLIAINSETGCTDSMTLSSQVQVILGGTSDVPNAFTPSRAGPNTASNNPLQNDFFLPKVEGVSQFNMKIYNRWGELLFESNDRTVGWDGYYNGVLMPQGVYVYRLELVFENGRRETKVGDITLIR